jgi:hypothetical protein
VAGAVALTPRHHASGGRQQFLKVEQRPAPTLAHTHVDANLHQRMVADSCGGVAAPKSQHTRCHAGEGRHRRIRTRRFPPPSLPGLSRQSSGHASALPGMSFLRRTSLVWITGTSPVMRAEGRVLVGGQARKRRDVAFLAAYTCFFCRLIAAMLRRPQLPRSPGIMKCEVFSAAYYIRSKLRRSCYCMIFCAVL